MSRRLVSRLARMDASEARWRASASGRRVLQRCRAAFSTPSWRRQALVQVLHPDAPGAVAARMSDWPAAHAALSRAFQMNPPRFVTGPGRRASVASSIRARVPGAASDAAAVADRIAAGTFDLLGYRGLRFDGPADGTPDWHLDPVHGRRAPCLFWSAVPYLDPACGDHKVIWELNRHQHLLALGRAYWLTGDSRYRRVALEHLSSWTAANPPLVGINWASMLELGFRALSWLWAIHFFANPDEPDDEPWLVDLLVALDRQLMHVEQNLSYYFSPNTHLLGEALALYTAGRSLTCLRRADAYARTGREVLVAQIARQIGADGGHLERSTHYHRYTLDFYLLALAIARITKDPVADALEPAVARLAFAARLLADASGRLPHFGDDDGGLLLPICQREPDDVRDTLAVAAALTGRTDLLVDAVPEEAVWMLNHPVLAPALAHVERAPVDAPVGSAALPDTGYFVSRAADRTHMVFDAGPHGYENGGHAHADALSLTLTVQGVPLLIDPGTGSYTAAPDVRDRFRSSALHNTLVVDGRSQSLPDGPFHWSHVTDASAESWRTNAAFDYVEGVHDGYAPLTHRRHLLVVHGDIVIVADVVEGTGAHDIAVHWHLDPRWLVQVSGRQALLLGDASRLTWACSQGVVERISGHEHPSLGWHSPRYGRLERTTTLRVQVPGELPLWFVSAFSLDRRNDVVSVDSQSIWSECGEGHRGWAVRVARSRGVDLFGVSLPTVGEDTARGLGPQPVWRAGGLETDARMLFCRRNGDVGRLAMVDGTFAHTLDHPGISIRLPRTAPDFHVDLGGTTRRGARDRVALPARW